MAAASSSSTPVVASTSSRPQVTDISDRAGLAENATTCPVGHFPREIRTARRDLTPDQRRTPGAIQGRGVLKARQCHAARRMRDSEAAAMGRGDDRRSGRAAVKMPGLRICVVGSGSPVGPRRGQHDKISGLEHRRGHPGAVAGDQARRPAGSSCATPRAPQAARPASGSPAAADCPDTAAPRAHAARRGISSVLPGRLPSPPGHDRRSLASIRGVVARMTLVSGEWVGSVAGRG